MFAGTTVMVALLSLAVVGIPLVTTLGYTSALVVASSPWPRDHAAAGDPRPRRRPHRPRCALPLPHAPQHDHHPHGWERWARFVARRPLPCALVALVVLVVLALPALDLYLGQQDNGALPRAPTRGARTTA